MNWTEVKRTKDTAIFHSTFELSNYYFKIIEKDDLYSCYEVINTNNELKPRFLKDFQTMIDATNFIEKYYKRKTNE